LVQRQSRFLRSEFPAARTAPAKSLNKNPPARIAHSITITEQKFSRTEFPVSRAVKHRIIPRSTFGLNFEQQLATRSDMKREYHRWYSHRLGLDMGVVVYGHWGPPLLGFPTSAGDEWELEGQGLIGSLSPLIDAGRVKFFSINSVNSAGFYNKSAHPFHRSWVQSQFDAYVRNEVVPFIRDNCQSHDIAISTMGASFGAYHAANTLFKHPDVVRRCFALSGVYDIKNFMNGMYDDNTYFNNPVDYLSNLSDGNVMAQLAQCDIHIATGNGPWENSGPSYRLSNILSSKGIPHHLDDWGPQGGHDWPFWKHQMWEYITKLF
jgi:esterase/lipase superfamily enzyme